MKFLFNNGAQFKTIISAIKDCSMEAVFAFNANGLYMQCLDSSQISVCELRIGKDDFDSYDMEGEDECKITLNIENLGKVNKLINNNDALKWSTNENTLGVTINGPTVYHFDLVTIDIETEELEVPETMYTHRYSFNPVSVRKLISDISGFSDALSFTCTDKSISINGKGAIGEITAETKEKDDTVMTIVNADGVCTGNFASLNIDRFVKQDKVGERLIMSMAQDEPIKLEYPIGKRGVSSLTLYLAPKIEDEM